MRVLVTGGAGFIGSALVRDLILQRGHEVLTVDKLTYAGNLKSLSPVLGHPSHQLLKADICDPAALAAAFASFQPDWVMHLAAESHVDRSISGAETFVQTNIVGTFNLLDAARCHFDRLAGAARQRFRFLHVSTDEVYGSLGEQGAFSEAHAYDPSSPYSASKAASDHLAKAWERTYGLPVVVSNCSNNYGPFQYPEKLIPLTISNAVAGEHLPVYGTGANVRDWLHVDDHVAALQLVVERGRVGQTYNIGANSERRNIDVVRAICRILDSRIASPSPHENLIRFVADRPGHDHRYAIDASKLRSELGWMPVLSFEAGIETTIDWYLTNPDWWTAAHASLGAAAAVHLLRRVAP